MSTPSQPMMPTPGDAAIIAQLQQQLEAKDQQLEAKDQQLEAKDQQLEAKDQQLEAKDQQLGAKERALNLAQLKVLVLEERLRQLLIAKYGKRSETLSDVQLQLLDVEPGVSSEEIEAESEREPIPARTSAQIRLPHPGRQTLPAHLERVEQIVAHPKCG